jgi:hypothetical protein
MSQTLHELRDARMVALRSRSAVGADGRMEVMGFGQERRLVTCHCRREWRLAAMPSPINLARNLTSSNLNETLLASRAQNEQELRGPGVPSGPTVEWRWWTLATGGASRSSVSVSFVSFSQMLVL